MVSLQGARSALHPQITPYLHSCPADERFGLTLQIRRAATSVPTNIADGCGQSSDRELARFLSIAAGSGFAGLGQ